VNYIENFYKSKEAFLTVGSKTELEDLEVHRFEFSSLSCDLLPGNTDYQCKEHFRNFDGTNSFYNDIGTIQGNVHIKDYFVEENRNFNYYVIKPAGNKKAKKIIFLFHGFNEKNWDKYLPWGKFMCEKTQSAVVFFPTAFHMQRAPLQWSKKRAMFDLCEERKKKFPNIINSSLSNVAISMRLHSMPQRFIWSGLQTYSDIIQFIEFCKNGNQDIIDQDFSFNIFAYSIGGLLAEILKLSNFRNYFTESKVCLFCGGAVFNRLSPVSKFILDSEANLALYSYLVEHFENFLKKDTRLNHYINESHFEGKVFHAMLEYNKMREFREGLLKPLEEQIYAISLKKDNVIPSFEIMNTLHGAYRNINIHMDEMDFDHNYTHENPFPVSVNEAEKVDKNFNIVFDKICSFFNN
jgi:hypothetical protein